MKRAKIFLIVSISILLIITTIFTLARLNNKQIYNNNTTKIDNNDKRIDGEINQNDDYKLFNDYYDDAKEKIKNLSLEEKISQLLLVRYPENPKTALQNYQFGGYILFAKDFANKTEEEVKTMINELQNISKIPLLIAVDEEGGIVNRVSLNPNLVDSPFKSSQELYREGGFDAIREDIINKSRILSNIGINLNLAPVVDVSTDETDFMYKRTLGQNVKETSTYAKTVIEASKNTNVSYTLKHFPGYGKNLDTHVGTSTDNRTIEELRNNSLSPFREGINAGAQAVLISHNVINQIDKNNPASLSKNVHNILREELNFTGIIITDALDMDAVSNIDNLYVKAIEAQNNLLIITDYKNAIEQIKNAVNNNTITKEKIDQLATEIIAWKYYKKLIS